MNLRESIHRHQLQNKIKVTFLSHRIYMYEVLELIILTIGGTSFLNVTKTSTFHWLLHMRFSDLLRWTVVIGAMLKTGFGRKVHIRCFVNEPTIYNYQKQLGNFDSTRNIAEYSML